MIIGIDARMFQEGLGIGRYIEQLLKHLERIDTQNEYRVFLRKKNFDAYQPAHARFKKICANYQWYSLGEQIFFPFLLMWHGIDCMHFPHFNVPILYPRKYIVTIHDLILLKFPQSASSAATSRHAFVHRIKYAAYRCILHIASRRAAHIITVSEYVKKDIISYLGISGEKISVIHEAADDTHTCASDKGILPASVKKPYILYTGNAYPHKNIEGLLQAFHILASYADSIFLVLCGQEDFFFRRIRARICELGLDQTVQHMGFVSEDTLCQLYRHASACIMPSFEEGFGLPALEALVHGLPVIVSEGICFEELLADAAWYVNPTDPSAIAHAIRTLVCDADLLARMREKGYARATRYSWDSTAQKTLSLYEKNS
ncbi:glycosyltransferase family 4 protein [Candidatus Uhrbacteria bacterium]|nr:glycosyltransferase family 4 protein [Candidatus Uhrbacteria bacterium]